MMKRIYQALAFFDIVLFILTAGLLSYLAQTFRWTAFTITFLICLGLYVILQFEKTKPIQDRLKRLEEREYRLAMQPNGIQLYGLTPHDGTALYDNLADLGVRIIEPNPTFWSRNVLKPVTETSLLSRYKIVELANQFIYELQKIGYTYLNADMRTKKIGASKTVATSFSPVQEIGGINPDMAMLDI